MSKPVVIALICACLIRTGAAKEYYFHNRQGDDANPGSREEPFKTLERMNQLNLERGDAVYFARGTSYYGSVRLSIPTKIAELNADANEPVHVGNYGEGPLPRFCNPEWTRHFGNVFLVEGEHVVLDGLDFHNGPAVPEGIKADEGVRKTGAVFLGASARHITVKNCEFFNCPIGVQSYGQHCLITRNHFHDCNNWLQHPHWGAIAIMVATSNHEISYNRIENYVSLGGAYGADGGGIELDGPIKKENIDIHHNMSIGNEGFLEFYDRDVDIENHDLRLRDGSPAIDAGADLGYQLDFENKRLPCGDRPEIGAFEYRKNQGEQK